MRKPQPAPEPRLPEPTAEAPGAPRAGSPTDAPWPWLDFLEMDHGPIDRDHREAIEEGNKFLAVLEARSSWPELLAILHQSRARSARHFATEDSILAASLYPGAEAHRAAHARILDQIDAILAELDAVTIPRDEHWKRATAPRDLLIDHCLKGDLLFKSHVMTHAHATGAGKAGAAQSHASKSHSGKSLAGKSLAGKPPAGRKRG